MVLNLGTIVTLALVALACVPLVRSLRKKGLSATVEGGCDGCGSGNCSSCSAADKMVRDMQKSL